MHHSTAIKLLTLCSLVGMGCTQDGSDAPQLSAVAPGSANSGGQWQAESLEPRTQEAAAELRLVSSTSSEVQGDCLTDSPCTVFLTGEEERRIQFRVSHEDSSVAEALVFFGVTGPDATVSKLSKLSAYSDSNGLVDVRVGAMASPAQFMLRATLDGQPDEELHVEVVTTKDGIVPLTLENVGSSPFATWTASLFRQSTLPSEPCSRRYHLLDDGEPLSESLPLVPFQKARFLEVDTRDERSEDPLVAMALTYDSEGELIGWACQDALLISQGSEKSVTLNVTPRHPRFTGTWDLVLHFDPVETFGGNLSAGVTPWLNAISSPALPLLTLACEPPASLNCELFRSSGGVLTALGLSTVQRLQANAALVLNSEFIDLWKDAQTDLAEWFQALTIEGALQIDQELPSSDVLASNVSRIRWQEAEVSALQQGCAEAEQCPESGFFLAAYSDASIGGQLSLYTTSEGGVALGQSQLTGHWGVIVDAVVQASLLPALTSAGVSINTHRQLLAAFVGGPSCLDTGGEQACCEAFAADAMMSTELEANVESLLIEVCHTMLDEGATWLTRVLMGETADSSLTLSSATPCLWTLESDPWRADAVGIEDGPCPATLTLSWPTHEVDLGITWSASKRGD